MDKVNRNYSQADNTGSNYLTLLTHIAQSMRRYSGSIHINHDLAELIAWDIVRLLPVDFSIPESTRLTVKEVMKFAEQHRKHSVVSEKLKPTRVTDNRIKTT